MGYLSEPQEVADYFYNKLDTYKGQLGLAFVGYGDRLIPQYPAVIISSGARIKQQHATHLFRVFLEISMTVYHARIDINHKTRTREDLALVTGIENFLETGSMDLDGQAVFAFVRDTTPGTITRPKGELVVGTRMIMEIETRKGFPFGGNA